MAVYLDVTRLLEWQGNYTGMERVAYEITAAILAGPKNTDFKLCCHVSNYGFVELLDDFSMKDGRLTSSVLKPGPSLRRLLKEDKVAFTRQYAARLLSQKKQKTLTALTSNTKDTLLIFDGLWDRQDYIASVKKLTSGGTKLAQLVHDVIPVVTPQVCLPFVTEAFTNYFKQITPSADILFSVSKNTEHDFKKVFGSIAKPSVRYRVIRSADSFEKAEHPDKPTKLAVEPSKFLLNVGTIEIRKNHQLLYQAYKLAAAKGIDLPKIVIVGREGWLAEQTVNLIKFDPEVNRKFIFAGPISDSQLSWLYANCAATVFPSIYEGWGLPVAESLFHGKVCAASEASSIPEIGGDLNLYYSPYSPEALLETVLYIQDADARKKLEKRIKTDYKPTTWKDTAATIIGEIHT